MADTTATTTESTPESGSTEFAQPRGVNDDAVWEKHFGKDAKFEDKAKAKKKEEPWQEKDEKAKKPASKPTTKQPEPTTRSTSKKSETSSEKDTPAEPSDSPESKTGKSESKKTSKSDSTEEAETAPSGKARELFEQAKAATNKAEGRKLYKQAMKEAFGEVPDEFNDGKWQAAREKRDADRAAIAKREQAVKAKEDALPGRLEEAVRRLDPAIQVMKILKEVQGGDYTRFGDLVAKALDKPVDEAMKLFVRGVKLSPEGRAARVAAEAAEKRAAAAEARIQEMERKLNEKDEVRTRAEQDQRRAQARESYLESIETELDGHPVLKLPRGKERVMAFLVKTADKATRAAKYTKEEAADRVVAYERKRLLASKGVLEEGGEPAAPAERSNVRTIPRGDSVESGVQPTSPDASFDRIWQRNTGGRKR